MTTATLRSETSHGSVIMSIKKYEQEGRIHFNGDITPEIEDASIQNPKGFRVNEFVVEGVKEVVRKMPDATKYMLDFEMGGDIQHLDCLYLRRRFGAESDPAVGGLPSNLYLHEMGMDIKPSGQHFSLVFKYK